MILRGSAFRQNLMKDLDRKKLKITYNINLNIKQ